MVLYKRKPIVLPDPRALPLDLNVNVWHIDETGEWFSTYKDFLSRMDFYTRHHFTCEISGASCLTFFQALDSEETQFKFVEEKFPIKLREPIARFLHFNKIRRLDDLVESVYSKFKNEYFPGETVVLRKTAKETSQQTPQPDDNAFSSVANSNEQPQFQKPYLIKEKAQFNEVIDPKTQEIIVPAYTKYMLIEEESSNGNNQSFIADQSQIYRDRSTFTKHLIKCFCKITLTKASTKMGAPWCVKEEYLPIYGLEMDWPLDMLKYKDDEEPKHKRTHSQSNDDSQRQENNYDGSNHEDKKFKKKKTGEDEQGNDNAGNDAEKMEVDAQFDVPVVPQITVIVDDLTLPYQGPPEFFKNLLCYNDILERVPADERVSRQFKNFDRLLESYQFLSTFGRKIYLDEFSIDQFVTTLKCSVPQELKGEVVSLTYVDDDKTNKNEDKKAVFANESDWERNTDIRNYIENTKSKNIIYKISQDEPADDELLEDINNNGTSLLIEIFVSLLRLFVNENGDWLTLVTEEWIEDETAIKDKKQENGIDDNKDLDDKGDQNVKDEMEERIEKCLNYRNVNWSERLTKRQFNNFFWLIILFGILQDNMHITTYTEIVQNFTTKVLPDEISPTQLPKQLWRNFCRNLTLEEKVSVLWVVIDLVANFSPDIKAAVELSMELCGQLRSERFRVSKLVKVEQNNLATLQAYLSTLQQSTVETPQETIIEMNGRISEQATKVEKMIINKLYLDKQIQENDCQRLKSLGKDRYGNSYYWLELNGSNNKNLFETEDNVNSNYHAGRLWVQGPNAECAKLFLGVSDEELSEWKKIAHEKGSKEATKAVFNIFRDESGAYYHIDESGVQTQLMSKDGLINHLISLSPIQKKILDETPDKILISDVQWYVFERHEDVNSFFTWLDTWGRREHDLIRQLKPMEDSIEASFALRERVNKNIELDITEGNLLKEWEQHQLTDEDLKSEDSPQVQADGKGSTANSEGTEKELEKIAEEIMALDDHSKTRQILDQIEALEKRRDKLLENMPVKNSSETPGSRIQFRTEKKRQAAAREVKMEKQAELLTDLLNHRHFKAMEDVIEWKNNIAIKVWGTSLRKNASGAKKIELDDSVDTRIREIMDLSTKILSTVDNEMSKEDAEMASREDQETKIDISSAA